MRQTTQSSTRDLALEIEKLKATMVSVATGGPLIDSVNPEYVQRYVEIDDTLKSHGVDNPNPYSDLWAWYGKWSSGDLPTYQSRRQYLAELFAPTLEALRQRPRARQVHEPTGWTRVDRSVDAIGRQLETARNEEGFQVVGLLCRETLISVAQAVYNVEKYPSTDGTRPSDTDAKRQLDAYVSRELPGSSNEKVRRHAKAVVDLAVELQHRRTAAFRHAALCAEATHGVVNLIAMISGRRDPD